MSGAGSRWKRRFARRSVMAAGAGLPADVLAPERSDRGGGGPGPLGSSQARLLLPNHFIPLAEETGLIVPLGRWVLRGACRQAREWQTSRPGAGPLTIAINVSARQLQDLDVVEETRQAIAESGVDPSLVFWRSPRAC